MSHDSSRPAQANDMTWTTKDGTRIPVDKMTDDHLRNAYMMCRQRRRVSKKARRWSRILQEEISRRDEAELYDECVIGGIDRYGSLQH